MAADKRREQAPLKPGQPYTQDRFGYRHPLTEQTADGPVELPVGPPDESWTNEQLDVHAGRIGVDVSGAKNKADRLTAIGGHREANAPALPPA